MGKQKKNLGSDNLSGNGTQYVLIAISLAAQGGHELRRAVEYGCETDKWDKENGMDLLLITWMIIR